MTSEGLTVGATARRSLPGEYYRDPDIFRLEYDRVFARSWFFVGRSEAGEDPRGYLSIEVVDQPIVVLRDREGVLRAFHNVCRHRGSLLVDPGRGQLRGAIKCPYHAWTYGLDGALVSTPHVGDGEIDCREFGLAPIRVQSWQGCLFVNLSGTPRRSSSGWTSRRTNPATSNGGTSARCAWRTPRSPRSRPTGRS